MYEMGTVNQVTSEMIHLIMKSTAKEGDPKHMGWGNRNKHLSLKVVVNGILGSTMKMIDIRMPIRLMPSQV